MSSIKTHELLTLRNLSSPKTKTAWRIARLNLLKDQTKTVWDKTWQPSKARIWVTLTQLMMSIVSWTAARGTTRMTFQGSKFYHRQTIVVQMRSVTKKSIRLQIGTMVLHQWVDRIKRWRTLTRTRERRSQEAKIFWLHRQTQSTRPRRTSCHQQQGRLTQHSLKTCAKRTRQRKVSWMTVRQPVSEETQQACKTQWRMRSWTRRNTRMQGVQLMHTPSFLRRIWTLRWSLKEALIIKDQWKTSAWTRSVSARASSTTRQPIV